MLEAVIHVVWDEEGHIAADVEASDAADKLDQMSNGKFRRVVAIKLNLPSTDPIELAIKIPDDLPVEVGVGD